MFSFIINNLLVIIPLFLLSMLLLFLKPFRKLISYCAKNIISVIFLFLISFLCSFFGFTLSLNIFSLISALLLGIPGISLALFLSLII
jgi:hypothetical protein